jgi:hypothetical protein
MASGAWHFAESERWVNLAHSLGISQFEKNTRLREAQVNATLAQTAAIIEQIDARGPGDVNSGWREVLE